MAEKTAAVNTYINPAFSMQPGVPVWETVPETDEQVVQLLKIPRFFTEATRVWMPNGRGDFWISARGRSPCH